MRFVCSVIHAPCLADGVVVGNNEKGFTERNMRSLCDVAASTKSGSKLEGSRTGEEQARTGEKGIGFKSVFAVSDKPHIVSGGFRIMFDAKHARCVALAPLPVLLLVHGSQAIPREHTLAIVKSPHQCIVLGRCTHAAGWAF